MAGHIRSQHEWLVDGFTSLEAGMDFGLPPHLIQPNQASLAINATFRGGNPYPRPGYWQRALIFQDYLGVGDPNYRPAGTVQGAFESGLFQGAIDYRQP